MRDNQRMHTHNEKMKHLALDAFHLSSRLAAMCTRAGEPHARRSLFIAATVVRGQFTRLRAVLRRRGVQVEKPAQAAPEASASEEEVGECARALESLAGRAESLADALLPEEESDAAAHCVLAAADLRTQAVALNALGGREATPDALGVPH